MNSVFSKFSRSGLSQFFLKHGFILEESDFGEKTSRRFVHCRVRNRSKNKLLFGKVARSPELAENLGREILLARASRKLLPKTDLIAPIRQLSQEVFLYPYVHTKRLSDYFDNCHGDLPAQFRAILARRVVDVCFAQRKIRYRPKARKIPSGSEKSLVRSAQRCAIYRRAELLRLQRQLDSTSNKYHFEIGDLQLQNMFWDSKQRALVLFDLEAWGEYRSQWSLASLFTISWFRHQGEQFSLDLFHAFVVDKRTTTAELHSFFLCCVYFVFIYYPKYSRRGRTYRRNFRRLVDWILQVAKQPVEAGASQT